MVEVAHSTDLNLPEKLRDREYRQKFFLAESSAQIAAQLIALRKRRDLNQQEVAELIGTQQPAISRIEKADYQSWSFKVLRKIADALDARIRVFIQPAEDILGEYSDDHESESAASSELLALKEILRPGKTHATDPKAAKERAGSLAYIFPDDDISAANQRLDRRDQIEIPKADLEHSARLQRPRRGLIDNPQGLASWS